MVRAGEPERLLWQSVVIDSLRIRSNNIVNEADLKRAAQLRLRGVSQNGDKNQEICMIDTSRVRDRVKPNSLNVSRKCEELARESNLQPAVYSAVSAD